MVPAAPEDRPRATIAASAASASQLSIAWTYSAFALDGLGSLASSTLPSVQSPSLMSWACEFLNVSMPKAAAEDGLPSRRTGPAREPS